MAYLPRHRATILNRVPIPKSKLTNGSIVEFRYKKVSGDTGLYMIIVLSQWPPAAPITERKIHSLSLDYISDNNMRRFVQRIGAPSLDEDVRTRTGQEVSKFILPKGRSAPAKFFKIKLSKVPGLVDDAYRTFNLKNMSQIKLLDYDFENVVSDRFLGEAPE